MSQTNSNSGLISGFGQTFLAGLFAALPLALTIAIILWSADFLHHYLGPDSTMGRLFGTIGLNFVTSEISAYAIGVASVVLALYLLGVLVQTGLRNHWRGLISGLLARVPFVRSVYQTLSRIVTMFDSQEEAQYKSMQAVLCYFGGDRNGVAVLALLTSPEPVCMGGKDHFAIMIPTAPVPFGGAILYAPVNWVEKADFGFDGLFNIYMSMGVTSGDYFKAPTS
ncbi:putative membrane protein [Alteromonadaceae bacterium 2753L.S.0a.02]|nr:putative membrane protein [Alteromonadaceae bacterium 2753L.S.0a.02]